MDVDNILDPGNYDAETGRFTPEFLRALYEKNARDYETPSGWQGYAVGATMQAIRDDWTPAQLHAMVDGLEAGRPV
jgi:hypothetical protein